MKFAKFLRPPTLQHISERLFSSFLVLLEIGMPEVLSCATNFIIDSKICHLLTI